MDAKKLSGIFTPNMVPLDDRGEIDETELRRLVDWLIEQGISGLYPNGSTGEFLRFSFEERKRIVRIVLEQTAGRVPVLAGAAEANLRMTLQACEYYHSLGAAAVAIVAPFYYKLSSEAVYAYFAEIARNTPVNVTLYNIPQFANDIPNAVLKRLCGYERIVGIKDSSRDFPRFMNMMHGIRPLRPDFVFLTGCEETLLPTLLMGADGGTIATSGVVPEVVMRLYNHFRRGELDAAREIQFKLLSLIEVLVFGADFPEGVRQALILRGFRMGAGRQPLSPLQQLDLDAVRKVLRCLLSDYGFTEPPAGGCDPLAARFRSADLERIVREVLQQLNERQ
ncbi:MAG: dihydrodipicolinate synthase family protein [Phycisphaerae bacterium]|nr:dihydrodipicolinate synthase family protein [Phycisphaerae bacterium]